MGQKRTLANLTVYCERNRTYYITVFMSDQLKPPDNQKTIAIVGMGPRGSHALECFCRALVDQQIDHLPQILAFESSGLWGYGHVYALDQPTSNWINISERHMDLPKRLEINLGDVRIAAFPRYHDWADKDYNSIPDTEPDTYPHRGSIGVYLKDRFKSIAEPLLEAGLLTQVEERVTELDLHADGGMDIITDKAVYKSIHQVLLTIGHQDTHADEQIISWREYAEQVEGVTLIESPYPIDNILDSMRDGNHEVVGIRGFGLATIDVVRAIAESQGHFHGDGRDMTFTCLAGKEFLLVPFSLDGLPMVPKPVSAKQDARYAVGEDVLEAFERKLADPSRQKKAQGADFLIDAIVPLIVSVYSADTDRRGDQEVDQEAIARIAKSWIKEGKADETHIVSTDVSTDELIQELVDMSYGRVPISLDYCIGQVWRHCQPTIYEALSYNECADDVFAEIIGLDEKSKRYSYGPPVESMEQLLALWRANVIAYDYVNDPDIETSPHGWKLQSSGKQKIVSMMVDSVLDSPQIKNVCTDLVTDLLDDKIIKPVHDEYGVTTTENAYLVSKGDTVVPIALLGRLAKGTVIGVDAILECFGTRADNWAESAVQHLSR